MRKRSSKPQAEPAKGDDGVETIIKFNEHQLEYLDLLRRTGLYGPTVAHVLHHLVLEGLRNAAGRGLIPKIHR